jgi:ferritin-like metal-binding protein YciE
MNSPSNPTHSKLLEFFSMQLQDIYWAETKLIKTLPKLRDAATSPTLRQAFDDHYQQTKIHASRLESVFELIGEESKMQKCPAMAGIAEEGLDLIDETNSGTAQRDVALIFAGQKAEHYEIATYGGLVTLAKTLGLEQAATLLAQTLEEEKETDALLSRIAETSINYQAAQEPA